ncbi:MAG TPA: hydroxymethylbilane synthase [Candidatus Desulfofervidus auxilii]|uniref:Porphobilinogen deaminase n=1 Tax=Desulfofervidus auxilii TaxID=1621989 RepID=A0A7V0NED0_DESA2|nr:hydroxymethylbilane synthase [Candidatus Desulfofervidus auxilii]
MSPKRVRIGSRGSILALKQTEWVIKQIKQIYDVEIIVKIIKTKGDKILDAPLAHIGGKGLFVKEIEDALLKEEIDLAVHSLKDVPTFLPKELCLGAVTVREDPRDAIITKQNIPFKKLPKNAVIGTSSLRRQAQLLHFNPAFRMVPLRGNVDTRLRKLKEQNLDAIVLASAGLKRLDYTSKVTEYLPFDILLPAIGQGALGIEVRKEKKWLEFVAPLNHTSTAIAISAERAFLKRLGGGCQVPIAGYASCNENGIEIKGMIADVDGKYLFKQTLKGPIKAAEDLGYRLAEILLEKGGKEILAKIYGEAR